MLAFKKIYRWVPSLYVMQGLPFGLVTIVSAILYKTFNFSNTSITFYTSLLVLPWLFKPLFSPVLEGLASKRALVLLSQFLMAALFFLLAMSLQLKSFFGVSFIIFFLVALASSVHDLNSDGFYIVSLNNEAQAHFVGVRTIAYQIGKLICQGGLVCLTGFLIVHFGARQAWQIAFILLGVLAFCIAIYHKKVLPRTAAILGNNTAELSKALSSFKQVLQALSHLPNMASVIIFTLVYNISETQLIKVVPLFLLDKVEHGGLALSIEKVGMLFGLVGVLGVLMGVLLSGFILAKIPLKKYLVPVTLFTMLTNLGYLVLSFLQMHSIFLIGLIIMCAQFGFGLSNGAYMLYLLNRFAKGNYPMSLYAIGTALMGLSVTIAGAMSGYLQGILGYKVFFIWVMLVHIGILWVSIYNSRKVL